MEEYPLELRSSPLPLVGLVGATQIHPRLIDALHNCAIDNAQHKRVKYVSFSYDMRIPPCKRGAKELPGYRIHGILKQRWFHKMCDAVPSVLVVCFDWSEDVEVSQTDRSQATSQLQHAQRQARERDLRVLVVVLIHPSTVDPEALCAAFKQQLDGTGGIVVVSKGIADLPTAAQKLERLLFQCARSFYSDEEKRLRKTWNPKPQHAAPQAGLAMQVRTNIKVGFLCEFRGEARGALMSYIKSYELLTHSADITDTVERLALCNYISLRMYQRYLHSRDMQAAVHQCRIHTQTLRSCADGDIGELAWLKWHWLSVNHHVFAQLLENFAQMTPALINKSDMWQFHAFHYQRAAAYASRLKTWARSVTTSGCLPAASGTGGDLIPAPFLGQAPQLDRSEECTDAKMEAALRMAHSKAEEVLNSESPLQLLTLAKAAYKERDYTSGMSLCCALIAEECFEEGNLPASTNMHERLRRGDAQEPALWPRWLQLRRFSLERSILCGCRRLGTFRVPALCCRSRPPSESLAVEGAAAKPADVCDSELAKGIQRQLLLDAFDYLSTFAPSVSESCSHGCRMRSPLEAEQDELLEVVRTAVRKSSVSEASVVEVPLDRASGQVRFRPLDTPFGVFVITLQSPVGSSLEISAATAVTSLGDVPLTFEAEAVSSTWCAWRALDLVGAWPKPPEPTREDRILAVRVSWAPMSWISLLIKNFSLSTTDATHSGCKVSSLLDVGQSRREGSSTSGVLRPPAAAVRLSTEIYAPVDASVVLTTEPFIIHVLVFGETLEDTRAQAMQLHLSCAFRMVSDGEPRHANRCCEPSASLIATEPNVRAESKGSWSLLPLSEVGGNTRAIADVLPDGSLKLLSSVFALGSEQLDGLPLRRSVGAQGRPLIAIPVVVSCASQCRVAMSATLTLRAGSQHKVIDAIAGSSIPLHFQSALCASFDSTSPHTSTKCPNSFLHRFTLKSITSVPVCLESACVVQMAPMEQPRSVLGSLGMVAPGAIHVFALPPASDVPIAGAQALQKGTLAVRFMRAGGLAAFFPWAAGRDHFDKSALGVPSTGVVEWPVPADSPEPNAPASVQPLAVELEHCSEGRVAKPLQVKVLLRGVLRMPTDLKVSILHGEGSEPQDRYYISGPTSTRSAFMATSVDNQDLLCASFMVVPLRAGLLHMPRIHVSGGEHDVISASSVVFAFPNTQCALPRVVV